jgi:hypothetical protein
MTTPAVPDSVPATHVTASTPPSAPPATADAKGLGPRIERIARRA